MLFEGLGVLVVDGGATMNPSTYELLAGVHAANGREVLVLPNSPNVILAAERAAELSDKPARVVPTTAPQEGLAALLAFDPNAGAEKNAEAVGRAAESLRVGGVAPAARDDAPGPLHRRRCRGIRRWRAGGLGRPGGSRSRPRSTASPPARELLTCLAGDGAPARPRAGGGTRARGGGGRVPRGRPTRLVVAALRGVTGFASLEELTPEELAAAPVRSYPRPSALEEPVELSGAGGQGARRRSGSPRVGDLIEHLPHSHRDRREVREVGDLMVGEEATVAVVVRSVTVRPMRDRRRKRVEARVADASGPLVAVWFNQPWLARQLPAGTNVLLHGRLRRAGEFWVSEHEPLGGGDAPVHTVGLVPVHPATEGLSAARLRSLVWDARGRFLLTPEPLPAAIRVAEGLPERPAALAGAHFPDSEDDERGARRRLAFEELLLLQLAVAGRRRARRHGRSARPLAARGVVVDRWRWSLPFELTGDQKTAMSEIDEDLARERPMQRLLMGEVGAGKTVVALHAMLRAVENGAQAALMAPTETLAEQHHRTLDRLLGGALPLELLTGSTPAARRRDLLGALGSGQLQLLVGTHALIEDPVEFRDLALCVVDEQHRFGVRQRAALDAKAPEGLTPHALHMTATPIPRTLSLTAYGDLDATALHELPHGRRPVETFVVDGVRARQRAYERIREEIAAGPAVLRGVSAGGGVGGASGQGGHGGVRAPAYDGVPRPARGADPRPASLEGQAGRDGVVRARRGRRAGGHERGGGGHRRARTPR